MLAAQPQGEQRARDAAADHPDLHLRTSAARSAPPAAPGDAVQCDAVPDKAVPDNAFPGDAPPAPGLQRIRFRIAFPLAGQEG
ncbi:hypothetical protein GCM10010428_03930 [Actinosynnema pretiosum subsp. pretiosum]